ncbi:glycosyltransferase family 4 protein [Sphingobacterium kyonggiense]|uniref:Glycosyltransferase family 4 protein n=1 Tax=Sphingobacterium kyonggiense TaxID=714075 RepID=A0ABP7Z3R9_9SPHI
MKILYFYQYFSTPKGSWGTRVYEFAKDWVEKGHEVTVITSVYSKSDLIATKLVEDQYFEGIHVKVINVIIDNKQSFLKRIFSFIKFSIISSYFAIKLPADIVIASSGPITIGLPGLIARFFRGRKLVFETRDLWPEGAIELGIIKNNLVKKLAFWFEKVCYKASSYIVTLSPGMTENIKKRYRIDHIDDVTNAANIEMFSKYEPLSNSELLPKTYAIYTGNIGMVNNSYWLFEAAKELKRLNRSDIKIVLIGEGQQREELEELAKKENITNFIRIGLMPKDKLISFIQNAFVSLVPLKGTPVLDTSSPNKFFESLAAGVPIIQNTNGWMKDFLTEHFVGYTLDPNNPLDLANKLMQMHDNVELTELMGQKALEVAKKYFDKKILSDKMLRILEKIHHGNDIGK